MSLSGEHGDMDSVWHHVEDAAHKGDFPGVLFLLRSLAEKGEWKACARIGELYETGPTGIDRDMQMAVKWYRRGVFEGDDPIAHLGLGRALFHGWGVERNRGAAKEHFEKAFAVGEAEAGLNLGFMCMAERDVNMAKRYFKAAADAGYCFAYYMLGRIAMREGRILESLRNYRTGFLEMARLYRGDRHDRKLMGIISKFEN